MRCVHRIPDLICYGPYGIVSIIAFLFSFAVSFSVHICETSVEVSATQTLVQIAFAPIANSLNEVEPLTAPWKLRDAEIVFFWKSAQLKSNSKHKFYCCSIFYCIRMNILG